MKHKMPAAARRLLAGPSGNTLAEVLVAVGIITLAVGMVGTTVFRVLGLDQTYRDEAVATKELRNAGSWFAGDALNAQATTLLDGATPAGSVTFTWKDADAVSHTATFNVSGSNLLRLSDGATTTIAHRVTSAAFSLSGKVVTFVLGVQGAGGQIETATLRITAGRLGT